MEPVKLWSPPKERSENSQMFRFLRDAGQAARHDFQSYDDLHAWSVQHYAEFWKFLLAWSGIVFEGELEPEVVEPRMPGAKFFPNVSLNFAENLLRFDDDATALVSISESRPTRRWAFSQLRHEVARLQTTLRRLGLQPGDRVAGFVPNCAEAVIAMLATTSLGGVWSSCSPDFGVQGVLDRFGQIEPRFLFSADAYVYNGKHFDCLTKTAEIAAQLPTVERVIVFPFAGNETAMPAGLAESATTWTEFLSDQPEPLQFPRFPFDHPLYVMFSSGTTGVPKCIVHGAGGTLLQHVKELVLHSDLRRGDAISYFTTCGWMMWNWLVSSLFTGCSVLLYDGSPSYPDLMALWRIAEQEGVTHFGTSAKFLASCRGKIEPGRELGLDRLRILLSTGSPLLPEDFDWVYEHVKAHLQLSSISGGTDIISCFMLGNPLLPVFRSEIQSFGLGMDVAALDESGSPVVGKKGELACRTPFPSMPIYFWNDADGT
jgi:acetoacetyl-CoA synthetase